MNTRLSIRPVNAEDLEQLLDLYRHLNPEDERCPPSQARQSLADFQIYKGSAILVGEIDGEMIASCTVVNVPNLSRGGAPYALIENVVTHADHRGRGHGTRLLDAATQRAWDHGCYKVMLLTGTQKQITLAFYEQAGFVQSKTGFQKRRKPPQPEPDS